MRDRSPIITEYFCWFMATPSEPIRTVSIHALLWDPTKLDAPGMVSQGKSLSVLSKAIGASLVLCCSTSKVNLSFYHFTLFKGPNVSLSIQMFTQYIVSMHNQTLRGNITFLLMIKALRTVIPSMSYMFIIFSYLIQYILKSRNTNLPSWQHHCYATLSW